MDNTREKLIELTNDVLRCLPWGEISVHTAEDIADHLIDNGVTVQKKAILYWKPVEKGVWNLTCSACDSHLGCREGAKHCPECGAKFAKPKVRLPSQLRKEIDYESL